MGNLYLNAVLEVGRFAWGAGSGVAKNLNSPLAANGFETWARNLFTID